MTASARGPRRHRRLTVRLAVTYRGEAGGAPQRALATTLGAGGLFVATPRPLVPGTRLRVRLRLPGCGVERDLAARVVWANDATTPGAAHADRGMGLAFTDPSAVSELSRELEALVEPPPAQRPEGGGHGERG